MLLELKKLQLLKISLTYFCCCCKVNIIFSFVFKWSIVFIRNKIMYIHVKNRIYQQSDSNVIQTTTTNELTISMAGKYGLPGIPSNYRDLQGIELGWAYFISFSFTTFRPGRIRTYFFLKTRVKLYFPFLGHVELIF